MYFIRQGKRGPIKIGVATNPERRMRNLQTANDATLRLVEKVRFAGRAEALEVERQLHELCSDYRISGEWFNPLCLLHLADRIRSSKFASEKERKRLARALADQPDSKVEMKIRGLVQEKKAAWAYANAMLKFYVMCNFWPYLPASSGTQVDA